LVGLADKLRLPYCKPIPCGLAFYKVMRSQKSHPLQEYERNRNC
jgi:hypothetical protein